MPCQMVGTPQVSVTRCRSSSRTSAWGVMFGPGKTRSEPASMDPYGIPHALAWNIGTTGSTTSRSDNATPSAMSRASECSTVERWL